MNVEWVYEEFGRRLRDERRERKLSQAYVAANVGLSRTSITNIERGRQRIPLHLAYQLAEAVRAEPSKLLPDRPIEAVVPEGDLRDLDEPEKDWVRRIVEEGTSKRRRRGS